MPTTQEKVLPYALTTVARVRDRLQITNNDSDAVLTRIINSVTDNIERMCGLPGIEAYPNDVHFVQKLYVNEIYTISGKRQEKVLLRGSPVLNATVTATTTANSATINSPALLNLLPQSLMTQVANLIAPANYVYGLLIQGAGIPILTYIVSGDGAGNFTLSNAVTGSGTNVVIEVSGLLSYQWRSGTPSNPTWTPFIQDQSEIIEQGRAGIIRTYGQLPFIYSNMLRATYIAGFPVDWQNAGNGATHRLPADLTNTCENIVVRTFKRLKLAGQASESIQGATLAWRNDYDAEDKQVITNHTRVGQVF
jgi:hypothetical protein